MVIPNNFKVKTNLKIHHPFENCPTLVFFSILWSSHTNNHPRGDLTKFNYISNVNVRNNKNPFTFWLHAQFFCKNMFLQKYFVQLFFCQFEFWLIRETFFINHWYVLKSYFSSWKDVKICPKNSLGPNHMINKFTLFFH
jgi:hypothetical protein